MALDEALLNWVAAHQDAVYLRTYGWAEPTLSLGYFQKLDDALAEPRWHGVPVVRRPTGGGAIWHHHELTYAIVVPAHHALSRPSSALYQSVHAAIAETLRSVGLHACRRAEFERTRPRPDESFQTRPFLCFTDRDSEDIVSDGHKIVGSAQRRHAGAILQHGSLLLESSDRTPDLPGVRDLTGNTQDPPEWSLMIVDTISRGLGLWPVASEIPVAVWQTATELEANNYRSAAWNARR